MNGVVLITIDALRCDHLSYMGTVSDTTPFLDSLAENGTSFTRHYSTGSGTSTSFPGIHSSSLPLDHGYRGLSTEHKSLAECLQTESVQTLGVTAQTSCSRLFDYHRGFDTFQDWIEEDGLDQEGRVSLPNIWNQLRQTIKKTPVLRILGRSAIKLYRDFRPRSCPYRRASEVTDMSLSLIQNDIDLDRRFFIWIHYMEPHAPYFPPDSYVSKFYDGNLTRREVNKAHRRIYESGPEIADGTMVESASQAEINAIRGYYAAATKYVDDEIRQLYSGLSDMGILEEAGLFVTADHGEELFDHGDLDHRPVAF